MLNLRKFWNALFSKTQEPFTIIDVETVPFHIKEISKIYPILHTVAGNRAVGEIKRFVFEHENVLQPGQVIIVNGKNKTDCIWTHLGNDYFKLVMKS